MMKRRDAIREVLRSAAAGLYSDRRGGVAIVFAFSLLSLLLVGLGAVDVTRAHNAKSRLQDGLDAAVLAAARESEAGAQTISATGQDVLTAHMRHYSELSNLRSEFVQNGVEVHAKASGDVQPIFLHVATGKTMTVRVEAVADMDVDTAVEIALVLDTTGSMAGTRISTLKTAAKDLVSKLTTKGSKGVRFAVVPFGQYVNVGVARRNEPWVDVGPDYSTKTPQACQDKRKTCQTETYACTKYNDGVPYSSTCTRSYNCKEEDLKPPYCPPPRTDTFKFNGCVGSPAVPKNVEDRDPTRRYPGIYNVTCGSVLTPLTGSTSSVKKAIDALKPSGLTYIPAGLAWGFNVLSPVTPFTEGGEYDPNNRDPRKVMVLMTDGENTVLMNHTNGKHDQQPKSGQRAVEADKFTSQLCTNIKAQNIEVFTVAFEVTDPVTLKMLDDCASSREHYFQAKDSAGLMTAFDPIAAALQPLHLSR
jgi:Flp pilus assembly protein TadG